MSLSIFHHGNYPGYGVVFSQASNLDLQRTTLINCAGIDLPAHGFFDRHRLAGYRSLVYRGKAIYNLSVHSNPFSRSDNDDIADDNIVNR